MHNFILDSFRSCTKVKISIKSFLFFTILLGLVFKDIEIVFQRKKRNRISILNAPYKNKLAQRQYYLERNFFFLKVSGPASSNPEAFEALLENLEKLQALGSFFFYLTKLKVRVRAL